MGFLAPLYALAALAIAGPIVFHLIRRRPKERIEFSSLMFLSPSSPRLSRRSRLDNLFLLALRALVILAIAAAFLRPYLRSESDLAIDSAGREVAIVVDTSASMRRDDVWQNALTEVRTIVDQLSDRDQVSLFTIDRELRAIVPPNIDSNVDFRQSRERVRGSLDALAATWFSSQLAKGLSSVADQLASRAMDPARDTKVGQTVILVSDLASGSEVQSLQSFEWPKQIDLDIRQIKPVRPGNASLKVLTKATHDANDNTRQLYVRISNNEESKESNFTIVWGSGEKLFTETQTTVQVPPGQSRLIPVVTRPAGADRMVLRGDVWLDDNTVYLPTSAPPTQRVVYCAPGLFRDDSLDRTDDPAYFIQQAPLSTSTVQRRVEVLSPQQLLEAMASEPPTAVFAPAAIELAQNSTLVESYIAGGGIFVFTLDHSDFDEPSSAKELLASITKHQVSVAEASVKNYALLGKIRYEHPVFAPLANPKFNDFSKIRFWRHRQLDLDDESPLKPVAEFDSGKPFLAEQHIGRGQFWVMTAGWQPQESTLALSSKFLPILLGILAPTNPRTGKDLQFVAGDTVSIASLFPSRSGESSFEKSSLKRVSSEALLDASSFSETGSMQLSEPGIYEASWDGDSVQFAVHVPDEESLLDPLDSALFESIGVSVGRLLSEQERVTEQRQRKVAELEDQQRLWQWLISAALGLLVIETIVASYKSNAFSPLRTAGTPE